MAAHVLRLRIALLLGALRGDRAHVARLVVGLVLLILATGAGAWAVLGLADAAPRTAGVVLVFAGAAVTLGFLLAPLMTGASDPMDPRRFAVLGMSPRPLALVLALAGVVSVPSLVLVVLAACAAITWTGLGAHPVVAAVSCAAGVATCALAARVSMAVSALALRERRSRELTGVILLGVLIVVLPVGVFFASLEWQGIVPPQLAEAATVLGYTPIGAVWAIPGAADPLGAGVRALIALLTLLALGAAWALLVRRAVTTTERPLAVGERGGLGWFAVAPGTPAGAIAARSLIYWSRDRRHLVNLIVVPVVAGLAVLPPLAAGVPLEIVALVPVPLMALFFGWLPHNDLAYDSTAVWMHLASAVHGISDRVGRLVPVLLAALPVLAVGAPVAIAVHGRWALLPAMVGICAALLLSGLGLSSISSALAPYAVSRPGDSPFQQPQRAGSGAGAQGLVLLGALLASAPALWWGWLAITRDSSFASASLWAGLAAGVLVLALGLWIGAAVFQRRGSRLMEFAELA